MPEETSHTGTNRGKLRITSDSSEETFASFFASVVDFIFFTDEKIFSLTAPTNLQNDRVYVPVTTKKLETPAEQLLIVGLYGYLMFA